MENALKIPTDWTEPEKWVWQQIADGKWADLYEYDTGHANRVPDSEAGWGEHCRLSSKFIETILTQKAFCEATPYGGVRIRGALIDDAPLNLEHARLQHLFWLENSRILVDVKCNNLRVDGGLSFEKSFVAEDVGLNEAHIRESISLRGSTFEGDVSLNSTRVSRSVFLDFGAIFKEKLDLGSANIGSGLVMRRATFEGDVNLNSSTVSGSAFLDSGAIFNGRLNLGSANFGNNLEMGGSSFERDVSLNRATVSGSALLHSGAIFKGGLDLGSANIGSVLVMRSSTFEGDVSLNSARVSRSVFLDFGAIFKEKLDLGSANIGSTLMMQGSTFKREVSLNRATVSGSALLHSGAIFNGKLNLGSANIGSNLEMDDSTFEGDINLSRATVSGSVYLRAGAIFKGKLNLVSANIGSNLEMQGSTFEGLVTLTECKVTGVFLLAFLEDGSACWKDNASIMLRNTYVGTLQDWWQDKNANAWPRTYQLEGFTYNRLGIWGEEQEAGMLSRPVSSFVEWLKGDPDCSPQPYEHLADRFQKAGEPQKATDILYAVRERQRRKAWSTTHDNKRDWLRALGLWVLKMTIGYGLGNRYFRVLGWVGGLTFVGACVLIIFGSPSSTQFLRTIAASFDQLLPIVTLEKANHVLIFGDGSVNPSVDAQPLIVRAYFYAHKIIGWILGSFLIAGLSGLTQKN